MNGLIQPGELLQELNSSQPPVVIDVRGAEAYRAGHLPGALHIPGDDLVQRLPEIPPDRPIVTY